MSDTQSKTGFTPGKWSVVRTVLTNKDFPTKHPHFEIGSDRSSCWIAHVLCFSDENVGSRYEANAHLIAAAKEMYAALELISIGDPKGINCLPDCLCMGCIARRALKSAQGEK